MQPHVWVQAHYLKQSSERAMPYVGTVSGGWWGPSACPWQVLGVAYLLLSLACCPITDMILCFYLKMYAPRCRNAVMQAGPLQGCTCRGLQSRTGLWCGASLHTSRHCCVAGLLWACGGWQMPLHKEQLSAEQPTACVLAACQFVCCIECKKEVRYYGWASGRC